MSMQLSRAGFEKAKEIIEELLPATPLVRNEWLSVQYGANIYLKLENLQPVGSFKLRGATNKMLNLTEEQKKKGVVAVSAGNHAQGVAWAARRLGIKATIIMPKPSPIIKILNTEALGAEVILEGENVDQSFEYVQEYLKEADKVYIHPFYDEDVIYGQGTIGLELSEQIDQIDYLFSSIGGGGLLSGVGTVVKELYPNCKIVGAQATGANAMVLSLQKGSIQNKEEIMTFADGIKVKKPIEEMFQILDKIVDEAIHVDDAKIAHSVLVLMEQARVISEGAAAITLAAFDELYQKNPRRYKNKNIVFIISGGNIDINLVDRIIEKGLMESNRRIKIKVLLEDRPGSLSHLTSQMMLTGANILNVVHDRDDSHLGLQQSFVDVTLETRGAEHAQNIIGELSRNFKLVNVEINES